MSIDLHKIAERARIDAARAEMLRHAIVVLLNHLESSLINPEVEFVGADRGYIASEEVSKTIKTMWPDIHDAALRSAKDELQAIERLYSPLIELSDYAEGRS